MFEFLKNVNPLYLSLGPVVVINAFFLSTLLIFICIQHRLPKDEEVATRHSSKLLNKWFREYWIWTTSPILKFLIKMGVTPNVMTIVGFVFSLIAGLAFANGLFGIAGWLIIAGGTCDIFDGRIARLTGKTSVAGGYFDSIMDRYGESFVFLGLAVFYQNSWIFYFVIAGLIGATMVSYTKARGEADGVKCSGGIMQRPERIVYIGVGSVFSPLFKLLISGGDIHAPEYITIAGILIVGVMTNFTSAYRIRYIYKKLEQACLK